MPWHFRSLQGKEKLSEKNMEPINNIIDKVCTNLKNIILYKYIYLGSSKVESRKNK